MLLLSRPHAYTKQAISSEHYVLTRVVVCSTHNQHCASCRVSCTVPLSYRPELLTLDSLLPFSRGQYALLSRTTRSSFKHSSLTTLLLNSLPACRRVA